MPAVIFDLDGTLVDLFELHLRGFQHVLDGSLGIVFSREDLAENYGKTGEEILRAFCAKKGLRGVNVGNLASRRRQWVVDNLGFCKVLPGAKELLEGLRKAGVPLSVGTSNTPELAAAILKSCGLSDYFRFVSCRTPEARGKPAPDIFLAAAKGLGVDASDCIVIEDSVYGVLAAKNGGMKVIAVASGVHSKDELIRDGPDLLVDSLTEVNAGGVLALLEGG